MSLVFANPDRSAIARAGQAEIVGARPHGHDRSAEMFYVLDGVVHALSGTEIVTATVGQNDRATLLEPFHEGVNGLGPLARFVG